MAKFTYEEFKKKIRSQLKVPGNPIQPQPQKNIFNNLLQKAKAK